MYCGCTGADISMRGKGLLPLPLAFLEVVNMRQKYGK